MNKTWKEALINGDVEAFQAVYKELTNERIAELTKEDWAALAGKGRELLDGPGLMVGQKATHFFLIKEIASRGTFSESQNTRWWAWLTWKALTPEEARMLLFDEPSKFFMAPTPSTDWPERLVLHKQSRHLGREILLEPGDPKDVASLLSSPDKDDRELGIRVIAAMRNKRPQANTAGGAHVRY